MKKQIRIDISTAAQELDELNDLGRWGDFSSTAKRLLKTYAPDELLSQIDLELKDQIKRVKAEKPTFCWTTAIKVQQNKYGRLKNAVLMQIA